MPRRTRGLSLIEVVVALFILALIMLGFVAAYSATATQRRLSDEDQIAQQLLASLAQDLQATSMDDLLGPDGTNDGNWTRPATDLLQNASFSVTLINDEVGTNTTATGQLFQDSNTVTTTTVSADDLAKLRMTGGIDLNANYNTTDGILPIATQTDREDLRFLPGILTLSWQSVVDPTGPRRSMTLYVYLTDY